MTEIVDELNVSMRDEFENVVGESNQALSLPIYSSLDTYSCIRKGFKTRDKRGKPGVCRLTFMHDLLSPVLTEGHNSEYIESVAKYAKNVGMATQVLRFLPNFLRPYNAFYLFDLIL